MKLRDIVPPYVVEAIRDRLIVGVADAQAHFEDSAADEDALTGALGQSIARDYTESVSTEGRTFTVRTYYRKVRGRGPGAPEKRLGADGIFQVEVLDAHGRPVWRKGLPFQAKKGWDGADAAVVSQARKMIESARGGLMVNYAPDGYRACAADVAIEHRGHGGQLRRSGQLRPLDQVLGNDFLNCDIGVEGLYYDPESETFKTEGDLHVIGVTVQEVVAD